MKSKVRTRFGSEVRRGAIALILLMGLIATPALADQWCGENGLVRFSFSEGDSLVSVHTTGEPEGGVTTVDLWAWLTDLDPVSRDEEAFLAVGGFELQLVIDGGEAFILEQNFPGEVLNLGQSMGSCVTGFEVAASLRTGQVQLVHWKIMFQGRPEDVTFRLDPTGLPSCGRVEGCDGSGSSALYIGAEGSRQLDAMFGAGYVPAILNPTGKLSLEPVRGTSTWQDVGTFVAR